MRNTTLTAICVLISVGAAPADWSSGDPHKMHHPQLPDPNGWDVRITNSRRELTEPLEWVVADDWKCSSSGPVTDVHFWVSRMQEVEDTIENVHLSIHSDIPAGTGGETYSRPADPPRWQRDFGPNDFTMVDAGTGDQGWFDPPFDDWNEDDHQKFYQINIVDIPDPFEQVEGTIYWLDISVDLRGEAETGQLGWKTSTDHFNDDAVYWDMIDQKWVELRDPINNESLDMAFVITPEPATMMLLAIGGLVVLRRRRR